MVLLAHGCIYELASGERCGAETIPRRHLCAHHITVVCGCGRQAVAETALTKRPVCTKCRSSKLRVQT